MLSLSRLAAAVGTATLGSSFAFCQYSGSVPPPNDYKTGFESINENYAQGILRFLAGPECEGRGTVQPGFRKAADFIAARFKEFGLKPMGDDGTYFQMVPFTQSQLDRDSIAVRATAGVELKGDVATIANATGDVDADGAVAMYVYGSASRPALPENVNLDGKVVFLVGDARSTALESAAIGAGAAAVVSVVDKFDAPRMNTRQGKPRDDSKMSMPPRVLVTKAAFASMKAKLFPSAPAESQAIVAGVGTLHIAAKIKQTILNVPNVVAMLEGSDDKLKSEYVGIGGHLDHLGVVNGVVYPGADDDGSGSTAVVCVARAMSKNPVKPKRSILFRTFCGEEMGLIGSNWLVNHPMVPLNKMVAEFQMDMVARDSYGPQNGDPNRVDKESENHDTIRLVGSKRISTELHAIIEEANKSVNFRFKYDAEDVYTRSDHYNFARNGIPIAFLFDGFTPSYHQPTDVVDTINFEKLANSARLYYLAVNLVANRIEPPKKDVSGN